MAVIYVDSVGLTLFTFRLIYCVYINISFDGKSVSLCFFVYFLIKCGQSSV